MAERTSALTSEACTRNWRALTVYGLAWVGVFSVAVLVVTLVAVVLGNPAFAALAMFPVALLMMAMFFTSLYFTFRDSFDVQPEPSETSTPDIS